MIFGRGPKWKLSSFVSFSIVLLLVVTAVLAGKSPESRPVLKVNVPATAKIRKVRSYSVNPQLSDVVQNSRIGRLQLLDLNNCQMDITRCQSFAVCHTNPFGITDCQCKRGFFLEGNSCKACRTSCPDNHYMAVPCSAHNDVVCRPCTTCEGSTYEIRPCIATQDRQCVDITFPNRVHANYSGEIQILDVSSSPNVFMEKLNKIKRLESTMYVTNNQQSMDFVWRRDSGLEIKIRVSEVYLVPEYIDLDHSGDNEFFIHNRNMTSREKALFRDITNKFCRTPLPDFYHLVLEAHYNRTSIAHPVTCDSLNTSIPRCPPGYKDGDTYISRSLNQPCMKSKNKYIKRLNEAPNGVYCTDGSPLVGGIFNLPETKIEKLKFPKEECENYKEDCNRCLRKHSCIKADYKELQSDCCNTKCLGRGSCKQLYGPICPPDNVECAQGDVHGFIIAPEFASFREKFMCHLKYNNTSPLYRISYEVYIPKLNYGFTERQRQVAADKLLRHQHIRFSIGPINVQHDTMMPLFKEAILIGKHGEKRFDLHSLKDAKDFNRHSFSIRRLRQDVFITSVQFTKPFAYSSSVWRKSGCFKNVSMIRPEQSIYNKESVNVAASITDKGKNLHYQVLPSIGTPYIRLSIEEDASILSWFTQDLSKSMLTRLSGGYHWDNERGIWVINLKGTLVHCPAYLFVYIQNTVSNQTHVKYDVLVQCPETFSINFNMEANGAPFPDIYVNDSMATYRVTLFSLDVPDNSVLTLEPSMSDDISILSQVDNASLANRTIPGFSVKQINCPWTVVLSMCVMTIIILLLLIIANVIFIHRTKDDLPSMLNSQNLSLLNNQGSEKLLVQAASQKNKNSIPKPVTVILTALYIMYCLIFTFSMLFGLIYLIHESADKDLVSVQNSSQKINNIMSDELERIHSHELLEMKRLFAGLKKQKELCNRYLEKSVRTQLLKLTDITDEQINQFFSSRGIIETALEGHVRKMIEKYYSKSKNFVAECNKTIDQRLLRFSLFLEKYLNEVSENDWFDFPRDLYMSQHMRDASHLNKKRNLADYLSWLQIDKAEELLYVREHLERKLNSMVPSFPVTDFDDTLPDMRVLKMDSSETNLNNFRLQGFHYEAFETDMGAHSNRSESLNFSDEEQRMRVKEASFSYKSSFSLGVWFIIIVVDVILLANRIFWLLEILKKLKSGFEMKVPLEEISYKILWTQTGKDQRKFYSFSDQLHEYDPNIRDDVTSPTSDNLLSPHLDTSVLHSRESVRTKESVTFRERPKESKRDISDTPADTNTSRWHSLLDWCNISIVYRFFISTLLWKVLVLCIFVLFLCLCLRAADSLLVQSITDFLFGANSVPTQLEMQKNVSDAMLYSYSKYLNRQLMMYKVAVDEEVAALNALLKYIAHQQELLYTTLTTELCNNGATICPGYSAIIPPVIDMSFCDFFAVRSIKYTGLQIDYVQELINSELLPFTVFIRHTIFSIFYLLLGLSCTVVICHAFSITLLNFLFQESKLPLFYVFQTVFPAYTLDPQSSIPKEYYWGASSSCVESVESGVYVGESEDHTAKETAA